MYIKADVIGDTEVESSNDFVATLDVNPAKKHMLKVNNINSRKIIFSANKKRHDKYIIDVVLVLLLLTMNILHTFS